MTLSLQNMFYIFISISIFVIVNFIINIILFLKLKRANRKIEKLLEFEEIPKIEEFLNEIVKKINKTDKENVNIISELDKLKLKFKKAIQKVNLIRYNAFEETGGDYCYILTILDEENNGVLLNSIYSRDGSYSYAKKITNGKSLEHKLSEDEKNAINNII